MTGKGSRQRPTDKDKFDSEFDRIFGKPKPADTRPGPAPDSSQEAPGKT